MQRPLNIWTEHSNCQIHSRGGLKTKVVPEGWPVTAQPSGTPLIKTPYSFTDVQYFLEFFFMNYEFFDKGNKK